MRRFCAKLGHAPKLLSAQRLPGCFAAIVTEYIEGRSLGFPSNVSPEERDKFRGDFRPPNVLCIKDKIILLLRSGREVRKALYLQCHLNPQSTEGREMSNLEITKEDDISVF